jgi:hypothetical protein
MNRVRETSEALGDPLPNTNRINAKMNRPNERCTGEGDDQPVLACQSVQHQTNDQAGEPDARISDIDAALDCSDLSTGGQPLADSYNERGGKVGHGVPNDARVIFDTL